MQDLEKKTVIGGEGIKLPVYVSGPEGAPAIIFVHGFAQSADSWEGQLTSPDLAQDYRLAAFDLRGHGDAEPKTGVSYDVPKVWADDIEAARKQLGLGEKVVLVGWSWGVAVAAAYLKTYGQEHVAGFVAVAGPARPGPDVFGQKFIELLPWLISEDEETFKQANRDFARILTYQALSTDEEDRIVKAEQKTPASVRQAILASNLDFTQTFEQLEGLPTWVAWGRHDEVVNEKGGRMVAKLVTGATFTTYDDAGHELFRDAADTFNADLKSFVGGLKF